MGFVLQGQGRQTRYVRFDRLWSVRGSQSRALLLPSESASDFAYRLLAAPSGKVLYHVPVPRVPRLEGEHPHYQQEYVPSEFTNARSFFSSLQTLTRNLTSTAGL